MAGTEIKKILNDKELNSRPVVAVSVLWDGGDWRQCKHFPLQIHIAVQWLCNSY
jgi:hypothetical protein